MNFVSENFVGKLKEKTSSLTDCLVLAEKNILCMFSNQAAWVKYHMTRLSLIRSTTIEGINAKLRQHPFL